MYDFVQTAENVRVGWNQCVKPARPHLNAKVERSDGADDREVSQRLSDTGDVGLKKKLAVWKEFYHLLCNGRAGL